ncbi:MAG: hypothetical protein K2K81_06405 [Muribaculaceae bacterium]|nr:hypothetical protein [Muribaculaceae bacterium]
MKSYRLTKHSFGRKQLRHRKPGREAVGDYPWTRSRRVNCGAVGDYPWMRSRPVNMPGCGAVGVSEGCGCGLNRG